MNKSKIIIAVVIGILLAGSVAAAGYFYTQNRSLAGQVATLKANPQDQINAEADALIAKVSALIVLPTDEKPTIATVTNTELLKDQPFFVNAEAGDKVLIYTSAKKAILYRPSENKIIEVAPVNLGATADANTSTTTDTGTTQADTSSGQ